MSHSLSVCMQASEQRSVSISKRRWTLGLQPPERLQQPAQNPAGPELGRQARLPLSHLTPHHTGADLGHIQMLKCLKTNMIESCPWSFENIESRLEWCRRACGSGINSTVECAAQSAPRGQAAIAICPQGKHSQAPGVSSS